MFFPTEQEAPMRKSTLHFSIDTAAFLLFLFLVSTGTLIYLILPPGSGQLSIWGMTRHEWGDLHFLAALGFLLLISVHLILHWNWIKTNIRGHAGNAGSKRRVTISVVIALLLLILLIAPFFSPVQENESRGSNHSDHTVQID